MATLHVLIVDDEPLFAASLARRLASRHCWTSTTHSVSEALAFLRTNTPDVVLADVCLEQETACDLKARVPFIPASQRWYAMSGAATREAVFDLVDAGYEAYFEKNERGMLRLYAALARVAEAPLSAHSMDPLVGMADVQVLMRGAMGGMHDTHRRVAEDKKPSLG